MKNQDGAVLRMAIVRHVIRAAVVPTVMNDAMSGRLPYHSGHQMPRGI